MSNTFTVSADVQQSVAKTWDDVGNIAKFFSLRGDVATSSFEPGTVSHHTIGATFTVRYYSGETRTYIVTAIDDEKRKINIALIDSNHVTETDVFQAQLRLIANTSKGHTLLQWKVNLGRGCKDDYFQFATNTAQAMLNEIANSLNGGEDAATASNSKRLRSEVSSSSLSQ